jgi:hypothetical protein
MTVSPRQEAASTNGPTDLAVLSATLVSYADRPDRQTVYPPTATSVARMSTWLTADADAFCDLASMR